MLLAGGWEEDAAGAALESWRFWIGCACWIADAFGSAAPVGLKLGVGFTL